MNEIKVAVVQAGSYLMEIDRTIEKACSLILEAGEKGAKLTLFPEAFIGGYPRGLDFGATVGNRNQNGRQDFERYSDGAITVSSRETELLANAAKQANAYVIMGVIEKEELNRGGTLYCSVFYFGPDGEFLGKHRKLKPTGSERLIWGEGDGSTMPVIETPFGRIGALICWENYMPLARTAMYAKGIDIYLAPTADSRDAWFSTVRHIALEGRCFVLSCNQYVTSDMYPKDFQERSEIQAFNGEVTRGGSCIVNPLGEFIVEPVFNKEEILYAELPLKQITESRFDFDAVGHYARNDIFSLTVDEKPKSSVQFTSK
ncbi:carbon-nitrogen hydrolase family protein [Rummeliibacillus pycnus]|uniref:carbon-nitrogen hydrolase family protein n=1 Tax=Rummeliibacillus pycnus TaxID=101070 RepID=UPI003D29378A